MANNGLGVFAGNFAQAFQQTTQAKQEQDRRDKIAKLQGQLVEMQMKGAQTKLDAQTQVSDMMSGNTVEELQPQSFDSQGRGLNFQSTGGVPQTPQQMTTRPEGISALLAAGQLEPILALAQGPQGSPTGFMKDAEAAGILPGTPEFAEIFKERYSKEDDQGFEKFMATVQASILKEDLSKKAEERMQREKTKGQMVRGAQEDVKTTFKHMREIVDVQRKLEGTLNATGVPFNQAMRDIKAGSVAFLGKLGMSLEKQRKLQQDVNNFDRLNKLYAVGVMDAFERLKGTGSITDDKMAAIEASLPGADKSSVANAQLSADIMMELLSAMRVSDIPTDQADAIAEWIKSIDVSAPTEAAVEAPEMQQAQAASIKAMGAEELTGLDPKTLSPEMRKAAADRWEELRGQ